MRLFIRSPDTPTASVDLADHECLLVGRSPEPSRLGSAVPREGLGVQRVNDSRVSANHALVSRRGDELCVHDLHSRNGTWLRAPAGESLRVRSDTELVLELASGPPSPLERGPAPANWSAEREFAEGIRVAIDDYLTSLALAVKVSLLAPDAERSADALTFPLENGSLLAVLRSADATTDPRAQQAFERVRDFVALQNAELRGLRHDDPQLIFASPEIRHAHRLVEDGAQKGLRIVLLGPTGAGKDRLARCYHEHSPQARGPFHAVNCGQLSKELMYAQLFGARKGSFTGSTRDLVGAVEAAAYGTLFLDEVTEMPKDVQVALLRFLDRRGEYRRLGEEDRPRAARNVQIICATNDTVYDKIARGELREDFWYRIAERAVTVPPLGERPDDILAFLKTSLPGERREDTIARGGVNAHVSTFDALAPDALALVMADPWRGNFRALESFVLRLPRGAARHAIGRAACSQALGSAPLAAPRSSRAPAAPTTSSNDGFRRALDAALSAFEADQGSPETWGGLVAFVEQYLKPMFVAHSSGLTGHADLPHGTNLSELARKLDLKDGTTVRTHLLRYFERFVRSR